MTEFIRISYVICTYTPVDMQSGSSADAVSGFEVARLVLDYIRVLIWPALIMALGLTFKDAIKQALERVQQADLPGGVSLDFDQAVQETKYLSEKVEEQSREDEEGRLSIPLTEANSRLIELGYQPSPSGLDMSYYREMAKENPNLALAGLRMELDVLAKNLAKGFEVDFESRETGNRLLRKLLNEGAITENQFDLASQIWSLSSEAVHGQQVSESEAMDLIEAAEVLAEQYISWLSWGFDDNWSSREH